MVKYGGFSKESLFVVEDGVIEVVVKFLVKYIIELFVFEVCMFFVVFLCLCKSIFNVGF